MFKTETLFAALLCAIILVGCEKSPVPSFELNQVEILKQEKASLPSGEHFADSYDAEIQAITEGLFGTPDNPKFPFIEGDAAHAFINLDDLKWAAGRVHSDQEGKPISGLYREHCAQCHGISGDGAGPTAAFLNPYPRDFRHAKFKFKSTPLRRAPTDDDLELILRNGIPGTAMPSFQTLPDEEIRALVSYVKYLAIRGQMERNLIAELSSLDGQPILDMSHALNGDLVASLSKAEDNDEDIDRASGKAEFNEQLDYILNDLLAEGPLKRWRSPADSVTKVPAVPAAMETGNPEHSSLVSKGRELFFAKGNCAQCHGETAVGDGETASYDDWTNDWIKSAGVNLADKSTYRDFRKAGALKPRSIRPRNLRLPVYRGGGRPEDLYLRIKNGIEGTPMPAAATLSDEEIWALVAYIRWLPYEENGDQNSVAVNNQAASR